MLLFVLYNYILTFSHVYAYVSTKLRATSAVNSCIYSGTWDRLLRLNAMPIHYKNRDNSASLIKTCVSGAHMVYRNRINKKLESVAHTHRNT